MRTCATCGASNPPEARFCVDCGSSLAERCERCGTELPGPVRFCPACGAPIAEQAPGRARERKLVTVLFADVTGSTGLGELLDPERLKEVMDAYFDAMRAEIEAEGGTVEKFIGDAVVAVFGVPAAHEDDATRALQAALRMRRRLGDLNTSLLDVHGLTLAMRVGVNTGEVFAVSMPRPGEGMVTGDPVNVAARLEQTAKPGQILVSDRTARAGARFRFLEVGPLSLKGKGQPVHAFELVEAEPEWERSLPAVRAPMVGREAEMSLLRTLWERVVAEGHPHLVTVYGDAGVGKSRLVREFTTVAAGHERPPEVVRGRCLPYGEGVIYWPLAEILKQDAGVLDSDPPELALKKIHDLAGRLLSIDVSQDPGQAAVALCFTVGLDDPDAPLGAVAPRQARMAVHDAWRSYLSALAGRRPTVVVIEDIHWADPALLDLLEDLATRVVGPLLFLCPARPELRNHRPGWGGGRWNASSIFLEPLSDQDSARLVQFLIEEDLPESIRGQILERAGGNPFFLEEIIRHLAEERRIGVPATRGKGAAGADGPNGDRGTAVSAPAIQIPDTVQGVLAARIDLLRPFEKRALQSAAVVGRVFWSGPVARLLHAEIPPERLPDLFERLEERELISTRLSTSMGGEREYIFKHILTRDVAYESLPRRDRAEAHAQVAAWLEDKAGGRQREFAELLAHHYLQAFRGAQDDVRRDPARAEGLRRLAHHSALTAAQDAAAKLALDEAERLGEQALALAAEPMERSRVLEVLGRVHFYSSNGDLAWMCLREAVDLMIDVEGREAPAVAGLTARALEVVTRGRGAMRSRLSREEAEPYLKLGLSAVPAGDSEELARLLMVRAFWPFSFRDNLGTKEELAEARQAGEEAAAMALRLGKPELASAALDGVATYYISRGLYGLMDGVVQRRLDLVEALEDPWELGDIHALAAWSAFFVGRYPEALRMAARGYERSAAGAPQIALYCLGWRALARFRLGDWDEFLEDVALAEKLLGDRKENPPGFASDHVGAAAFVHEVRGDHVEVERLLPVLSWLGRAEERPSPGWAAWFALLQARRGAFDEARALLLQPVFEELAYGRGILLEAWCDVLAEEGSWDEVPDLVVRARQHAEEAGLVALPSFAVRLEGRAALAGGDPAQAADMLRRAAEGFDAIEARWEAACTRLSLADALAVAGRTAEAREALGSSLPVFEPLRSRRELERARDLLERLG